MVPKGCSEAVVQGEIWSVAYITRMCLFRVRGGDGEMFFFGFLNGAASVRVGRRREGAKERAVGHPAAATASAIAALIAHAHDTLSPLAFAQVNGHIRPHDAMRIIPRCQCASNALRASFGGQLPTDRGGQVGEDESAHLGLVAGTCRRYQANSGNSFFHPLEAIACTRTTKAHRRYRDHLWTFAVYRSPVDV